jgi:aspartate carbamoyltransferase catalytic subunit
MHPGSPDSRVEIEGSIVESSQCITDDQITNGVAIRMALLYLLSIGRRVDDE